MVIKTFLKKAEFRRELYLLNKMKDKLKNQMKAVAADPNLDSLEKRALRRKMLRDFSFPMIVGDGQTIVKKWNI